MSGNVLVIAGSDSSGGAGIQADIKAIMAMGGYAATAITALTAQNTRGVHDILPVDGNFLRNQINSITEDIDIQAIKTGMLFNKEHMEICAELFSRLDNDIPIVIDPVMVATSGDRLLEEDVESFFISKLLPYAYLVTPNIAEAELLSGMKIRSLEDQTQAAYAIREQSGNDQLNILVKGAHLEGDNITDIVLYNNEIEQINHARIDSKHTHGTGCTLASAIAATLAQDIALPKAVRESIDYVAEAIRTAPGIGKGHGPINHACNL